MDRFQAMQVFTRIVETNSFSKAAQAVLLSPSSVTTIIRNLEHSLGVQLLQRTTRRIHLTPDGATYYESCRRILNDVEQTETSFRSAAGETKGRLRVEVASSIGRLIVLPALGEFQERFPDIELSLGLGDKSVDLVQGGIDCAIRAGEIKSSRLVARRIGMLRTAVYAAPAYLARHGEPETIQDLLSHQAVGFVSGKSCQSFEWDFLCDGETVSARMNFRVSVDESDTYVTCGVQGMGLIRLFECCAQPYLRSGRLREVLGHLKTPLVPLSAIYPHSRFVSPAVRAFSSWIVELFKRGESALGSMPALAQPVAAAQ